MKLKLLKLFVRILFGNIFSRSKPLHSYPVKKDKKDSRDYKYHSFFIKEEELPKKVSWRNEMTEIVDQGNLGSCTSNMAVSGTFEALYKKTTGTEKHFSRLFHYYCERDLEGTVNEDSGAQIRDAMKVLCSTGVCLRNLFPYVENTFTQKPTAEAYIDAGKYKLSSYYNVDENIYDVKHALANHNYINTGINVFESFESQEVAKTGIVPKPKFGEKYYGGHAVLLIGYDDEKQMFEFRNSWGTSWGDKGYFWVPYDTFKKLVMTMWIGK